MEKKLRAQSLPPMLIQGDASLPVGAAAMGDVEAAPGDPAVPADIEPWFRVVLVKNRKRGISKSSAFFFIP